MIGVVTTVIFEIKWTRTEVKQELHAWQGSAEENERNAPIFCVLTSRGRVHTRPLIRKKSMNIAQDRPG